MSDSSLQISAEEIGVRLHSLPGVERLRAALAGERAYLVGGAVRDLLLGSEHPDLDIAVEGDVAALAESLGGRVRTHERFATATCEIDGLRVDLAATRAETYSRPGALPDVRPATITEDLARRDFTVNAMAVPLAGASELIDPHGGLADLNARLLRVLHARSFRDDPTRALRAARYAARLGFELEARTSELLASADLGTVSRERIEAELRRAAGERTAPQAFELLAEWGLADIDPEAPDRIRAVRAVLSEQGWSDLVATEDAVLAVGTFDPQLESTAMRLAATHPAKPSEAVAAARGCTPIELVAARAAGAAWLDDYVSHWRNVRLEIDGDDLLQAGIPEGPAVGRGLEAALAAKLDGEASGRGEELRIALSAAA